MLTIEEYIARRKKEGFKAKNILILGGQQFLKRLSLLPEQL